jgi:hypothetical protein
MRLRVEDEPIERDEIIVSKQQVQVFEASDTLSVTG